MESDPILTMTKKRAQQPAQKVEPKRQRGPRNLSSQQQRRSVPNDRSVRPNLQRNPQQIGSVVRSRLTPSGMGDILKHRIAWQAGTVWVGNGTNGTADSVYFLTKSGTYIIQGKAAGSGFVPIAASDTDVGASYIADVEKHYARKVVRRMWIHIDSLQPSTSNNMMCVFGVSRGPGGGVASIPITAATAAISQNNVGNVMSMKKPIVVDSWEHISVEITDFIAGGSGSKQNEFEIQGSPNAASIYAGGSGVATTVDLDNLVPACFCVAGTNTTAALRGTSTHIVTIEQEVDYLDYLGGQNQIAPIG